MTGQRALHHVFGPGVGCCQDAWWALGLGRRYPQAGFVRRPGQRIILNQLGEVRVRPNPLELQQQASLPSPPLPAACTAPASARA